MKRSQGMSMRCTIFIRETIILKSYHHYSKIAKHIASAAPANRSIMLDPFCGAGGNTIAFALSGRWKRVYAIEKDPATLECAMQNARVYGVHDQITWFEGDCFEILGLLDGNKEKEVPALRSVIEQYGVVFASPPWGGKWFNFRANIPLGFHSISMADKSSQARVTRAKQSLTWTTCSHIH
jgi:predicted RNA methylase